MPVLTGMVLDRAQAGSLNPLLSIDGYQVAAIYRYTASDSPRAENGARSYATNITVPAQRALTGIQNMVGDCFASVQEGRFATRALEKIVGFLLENGAAGAGQSSWGPTVYGLVDGEMRARKLVQEVRNYLTGFGGGSLFCVQAQNRGAQIRSIQG